MVGPGCRTGLVAGGAADAIGATHSIVITSHFRMPRIILRRSQSKGPIMLLAEFSIWPMDKGESVGAYVARALAVIDQSGLDYRLGPMGTTIEGEWEPVMAVVSQCFRELARDCNRISCSLKIDYRNGHTNRLEAKVASVEKQVGRKLKS